MDLNLFLPKDQREALKHSGNCNYNLRCADEHRKQGHFKKAAIYHQNVSHGLEKLQELKNDKEAMEMAKELLGQKDAEELRRLMF